MQKIITFAHTKGGVGKSTLTFNVAVALERLNKSVLVVDLDYQATVWHENKSGNISVYTYLCALRASASYNYLLVNGERRLTTREMLRLQGFPDDFKIACSERQTRKQAGNSLPANVAREVIYYLLKTLRSFDLIFNL